MREQKPSAKPKAMKAAMKHYFADYGMVVVLLLLGAYYSWETWEEQHPTGESAAASLVEVIQSEHAADSRIMIMARANAVDKAFSQSLRTSLEASGYRIAAEVNGDPGDARKALVAAQEAGQPIHAIVGNHVTMNWAVFNHLATQFPVAAEARLHRVLDRVHAAEVRAAEENRSFAPRGIGRRHPRGGRWVRLARAHARSRTRRRDGQL